MKLFDKKFVHFVWDNTLTWNQYMLKQTRFFVTCSNSY